jgi:hypothetical protein
MDLIVQLRIRYTHVSLPFFPIRAHVVLLEISFFNSIHTILLIGISYNDSMPAQIVRVPQAAMHS